LKAGVFAEPKIQSFSTLQLWQSCVISETLFFTSLFIYKKTCPLQEQAHFVIFLKNTNMAL
jgi:hypothetical protein